MRMTQKEMAAALGISTSMVYCMESGRRKVMPVMELAIECLMRRRGLVK